MKNYFCALMMGVSLVVPVATITADQPKKQSAEELRLGARVLEVLMDSHGVYETISPQKVQDLQAAAGKLTQLGLLGRMLSGDLLKKMPVFTKVTNLQIAEAVDEGTLQQLPRCFPNVETLMLTYASPLKPDSIGYLSSMAKLKGIILVDLGSKNAETFCATDETCQLIGKDFPHLTQLVVTLVSSNTIAITDAGIEALIPLTELKTLVLNPCEVSDQGLQVIGDNFPALQELTIKSKKISPTALSALSKKRPKLHVK